MLRDFFMRRRVLLPAFALAVQTAWLCSAQPAAPAAAAGVSPADSFEALIQKFVENRREATGNLSRAAIDGRIAAQKTLLTQVRAIQPDALSPEQRIDHALMIGQLEGTIFEQEVLRPWEKNPELYLQYGSLANLMDQPGDPVGARYSAHLTRPADTRGAVRRAGRTAGRS